MSETIQSHSATGEEVFAVIQAVQPTLEKFPIDHTVMACLSIVMLLMNPGITPIELQQGLTIISKSICDYLGACGNVVAAEAVEAQLDLTVKPEVMN